MTAPIDNETWLLDVGDEILRKKAEGITRSLTSPERLLYCLWVADYSMRNAGDLAAAGDLYRRFHEEARQLAEELRLPFTLETFSFGTRDLEREYFSRFDRVCDEIRRA